MHNEWSGDRPRLVLIAGEGGWPLEVDFRAVAQAEGYSLDIARDVNELRMCVERLGEEPCYILVHQTSLLTRPEEILCWDGMDQVMGECKRLRAEKPGQYLRVLVIEPGAEDPHMKSKDWGDLMDLLGFEADDPRMLLVAIERMDYVTRHPDLYEGLL